MDCDYEVLGLRPGATAAEVKQAYRDLARVWHPDRFASDPRLQEKAAEKLKEINRAFENLTSVASDPRATSPRAHAPSEPAPPPRPAGRPAGEWSPPVRESTQIGAIRALLGIVFAIVLLVAAPRAAQLGPAAILEAVRQLAGVLPRSAAGLASGPAEAQLPAGRLTRAVPNAPQATPPRTSQPVRATAPAAAAGAPDSAGPVTIYPPEIPQVAVASSAARDPFTLGSSERLVRRGHGRPDTVDGDTWHYGSSTVTFNRGRVVGYTNAGNLNVGMTATEWDGSRTFGLGASQDQVIATQGTPSAVAGDVWHYGSSTITFTNGVVAAYSNTGRNLRTSIEWRPRPGR